MKKDDLLGILSEFSFKTALYESVNWDDAKLQQLTDYLSEAMNEEAIVTPETILSDVLQNFGHNAYIVVKEKFTKTIFENNLHLSGEDIEH